MQALPHLYRVSGAAVPHGTVAVAAAGVGELQTTPPPQYGGPEGYWGPETLLLAAVADCYLFSFRAVASASKQDWQSLRCEVEGTLDKDADGIVRIVDVLITARLAAPATADSARLQTLLEKAKRVCLVSNSLKAVVRLESHISAAAAA